MRARRKNVRRANTLILLKKTKKKAQIKQKKYIRFCVRLDKPFCVRLDKMRHTSEEDFRSINWLATSKRVSQYLNTTTFKFVNTLVLII